MPDKEYDTAVSGLTCSQRWTRALRSFNKTMLKPFLALSHHAATHPKTYIVSIILLSVGIMCVGIATNFTQETDNDIWTPQGSKPLEHGNWIKDESNFPKDFRTSVIVVHREGKNLFGDEASSSATTLARDSAKRLFQALDCFRETPRYDELCNLTNYKHPGTNATTCQIVGASSFWNDSTSDFYDDATSNEVVLATMSSEYYPFGGIVDRDQIIGFNRFDEGTGILNYGQSYVTVIFLPPDKDDYKDSNSDAFTADFEKDAIDRMLDLQDQWNTEEGNDFKVEIITGRSFEDEFGRAVTNDLPLIPLVFVLMSVLCIALFSKCDSVLSRSWVGFGAVITVLLAIIASFGLLFTIGVPFTSLTPLLPFILFGVGLDDAFIIAGAYSRTDHTKKPVDRLDDTMNDIGVTILLTMMTSTLAFALGAASSIPAVNYLVMYAFPTIIMVYLFMISFFVSIIAIDQRRIEDNRRDCCFCCKAKAVSEASTLDLAGKSEKHFADRVMGKYAVFLLRPPIKWLVIILFALMVAIFSWRLSMLKQYFDFTKIIPGDSYIQGWWDSYQTFYEANGVRAAVYFRYVDFSDENIQNQMETYVSELAAMPYAGENEPFRFWLRDFRVFASEQGIGFKDLTFEEQIKLFLKDPVYFDSYGEDIVLDDQGVMTASRTLIRLNKVDEQDVLETVDVLELQESISFHQPVNQGRDKWAFFTFAEDYYIWEFYRRSPYELKLTTIIGVISVSALALLFIPHWTAILFVGPLVAVLYIDLLGFIEVLHVNINPVMYISTVMSIGLMVDFLMHVTLRYVETKGTASRTQKTVETLETIGASVFVGGFSTLVGVLPLALSTSEIFWTTFIVFFGLVLLGLLHGLVLLPVLLAMFGPLESITEGNEDGGEEAVKGEESSSVGHHTTLTTGGYNRRNIDDDDDDESASGDSMDV